VTAGDRTVLARDARYLALATKLLQRTRLTSVTGGIWEAADVQWWSRRERATDRDGQLFWLDKHAEPVAAVVATEFGSMTQYDVLGARASDEPGRSAWTHAVHLAEELARTDDVRVEVPVPADSPAAARILIAAGYRPTGEQIIASWLDAAGAPQVSPLAAGYRLRSRAESTSRPHPLIRRNGVDVAERLARCSLYRPELDLWVETPDGDVAAYGLFWADPVTLVGLVEPMRTEEQHQRRGIARHILTSGLAGLAGAGCTRLKVSNDIGLYVDAGFEPTVAATIYARTMG
jgi:predicted N-acetyltransferase YhbS